MERAGKPRHRRAGEQPTEREQRSQLVRPVGRGAHGFKSGSSRIKSRSQNLLWQSPRLQIFCDKFGAFGRLDETCNKELFGMFNGRNFMKRFSILTFCLISALAITVRAADGQTDTTGVQNGGRVPGNGRPHTTNVHRNAPISQNVIRTPANVSPGMINSRPVRAIGQTAMNLQTSYSPFSRPLNPTLAEMSARRLARSDNVQPNRSLLPRGEIVETTLPTTNAQRMVRTDDLQSASGLLAKREISESPETIDTQRIGRNNNVRRIPRDLATRETRQQMAKWNQQTGRNRFSYSDALRRHQHEWHNRDWWRQHCSTIVFVSGGYYFLDAGYWYPAWGYDPSYNYYDQDGPIYTYGNLLPDQVIANVQAVLQDAGYYAGPVTGSLNVETRAALANYQRDQGLLITGAIDEPTIESLGLY